MAKFCGKLLRLGIEDDAVPGSYIQVASVQSEARSYTKETVDVTDKTSMPDRELIDCGVQSQSFSMSGFADDSQAYTQLKIQEGQIINVEFTDGQGNTTTGPVQFTTFEETGEYNGAIGFSATFESAGAFS